jgi:PAS domain S-box-containing protein
MRLSLASRLALVTALLAVLLVAASMVLFYSAATLALENSGRSQVEAAAEDKAAALELFFRGENAALQSIARDANIIDAVSALLTDQSPDARAILEEELVSHATATDAFGVAYLIDAQRGVVLASTDAERIGTDLSSRPFFTPAIQQSYVAMPSADDDSPAVIILATPLMDRPGNTIAVLVGELDLGRLQDVIGHNFSGGPTREIYLVNAEQIFLTQPRLAPAGSVLTRNDKGQAAILCTTTLGSGSLTARDYRSQLAVMTYHWMPDYHVCIISKMDRAEAIAPLRPLLNRLYGLGVLVLGAAVLVAILFARMVTRPLLALQRGVEAFGRGDLSQRIPVTSDDELGLLASSFNTMADSITQQDEMLRESNRMLEEKVAEGTDALQASEGELRALFAAMQDVVLIFDRNGKYLHSAPTGNRRLRALLRRVHGKTLHQVLPWELADRSLAHIRRVLAGQVVTDFEYELLINNERMYFSANISALTEDRVIWVVRDLTGRFATQQALARSEALNRAVVENSPVGISIRDRNLKLVYANDAWCRMRGVPDALTAIKASQDDHRPPSEILAYLGEDKEHVLQIYKQGGSIFIPEIDTRETIPGAATWVSQYFYGILDDGDQVESVVTMTQDITGRKESEQEVAAILEFSAAMRRPISRAETQSAILDYVERIFATEAVGIALRQPGNPNMMIGEGRGAWQHWVTLQQPASVGALGEILRTGEFMGTDDALSDPRVIPRNVAGIPVVAAAPLATRTQVMGALVIGDRRPLPKSKVRLLRAISEVAAGAINRAILFEETERRLQWLQAIRSIDRAIMGSMDVRITMNIVLEKAVTQLSMDAVSVLLLRGNHLEYAFGRGFKTALASKTDIPLGQLQAGKAALENVPIFIGGYDPAEWQCELLEQEGFRSYAVVPLNSKGQVLGVLEVFGTQAMELDLEWMDFFQVLAGLAALSLDTATLLDTVQRTNLELAMAYDVTLEGWSRSIDLRYDKVPGHTTRVVDLTLQLAQALAVSDDEMVHIRRGAFLHDVGTIMVPEEVLLKPGKLSAEEEKILHAYPTYSYEMLRTIDFLRPALDIPYCHHEKWDGSGFPRGLKGIQIPFPARIFSVVEAWDSLTHNRPYRQAWPRKKALRYIAEQSGQHFDPEVVQAFLRIVAEDPSPPSAQRNAKGG